MSNNLAGIRAAEKSAHTRIYSSDKMLSTNSWLQKPAKVVQNALRFFDNYNNLHVLDLGCGIGRNCIFIAEKYGTKHCTIDCVDLLNVAIEKLRQIAKRHCVEETIHGIVQPIEDFKIQPKTYDLILAISALEHVDSKDSFVKKLVEIKNGLKKNGVVCLLINSNIKEIDSISSESLEPQFEVQLSSEEVFAIVDKIFAECCIIERSHKEQEYDIPRDPATSHLFTSVITYVIQAP